jgi:23S rRNA (cytidine2498-2'-O)-methyltransferase
VATPVHFEPPRFVFALAQPAAAAWLKRDIAARHPQLRFAFSRPGLYTFKVTEALRSGFALGCAFARHWGFSLGSAATTQDVVELSASLFANAGAPLRLFVSSRNDDPDAAETARVDACRAELLGLGAECFHAESTPEVGDVVLDVVLGNEQSEPLFVGYHTHDASYGRVAGGIVRVPAPPNSPSRAYSKLREAVAWANIPLRPGDHAIEVGCAPGGAVLALLEMGLTVTGIDPAEMAPELVARAQPGQFVHLQRPVGEITRTDLPRKAKWLFCDANLAPQTALRYLTRMAKLLRPELRAIVFTVKLNDERVVKSLPSILEAFGRLGKGAPRAVQLPSHRSEVVAFVRV